MLDINEIIIAEKYKIFIINRYGIISLTEKEIVTMKLYIILT